MTRLYVPVPVRWADMDAYGHVNNVAALRLLEEARIAAFWRHPEGSEARFPTAVLDATPDAGTHTIVARHEVEYLQPIGHRREPVTVEMWLGRLGGASIEVCYEMTGVDAGERTVFLHSMTTLVLLDARTGRPRRITPSERQVWEPYCGPPVQWKRRSAR
jgi:acyl-CoA thioester hydrolase